jgi:hypothetical protein
MPPLIGTGDRMPNDCRACLLRAARHELLTLKNEHNRLQEMAVDASTQAAADDTALEIGCLQRAVSWLWRDQLADDV